MELRRSILTALAITIGCIPFAHALTLQEMASADAYAMYLKMRSKSIQVTPAQTTKVSARVLKQIEKNTAAAEKHQLEFPTFDTCLYSDNTDRRRGVEFMTALEVAAGIEANISDILTKTNYPKDVWAEPLDRLMRSLVETISTRHKNRQSLDISAVKRVMQPHERAFLAALEKHRRSSSAKLAKFSVPDVCGGDWIGMVKVGTAPVGGRLKVMREFYFQLCKVANVAPYSDSCDMWLDVNPQTSFPEGTYRYRVRWAAGQEECGKRDFMQGMAQASERPITRTVEQSGVGCKE